MNYASSIRKQMTGPIFKKGMTPRLLYDTMDARKRERKIV